MLGVSARHSGMAWFPFAPQRLLPVSEKDYFAKAWINETRAMQVCPHVTQNINGRRSVTVDCITRQPGQAASASPKNTSTIRVAGRHEVLGPAQDEARGAERAAWLYALIV